MAVTKRQGREKPAKIEQRKVRGPEWEPQVEQTALLANPVHIGQAPGEEKKHIKREAKIGPEASLHVFWVGMPSWLEREGNGNSLQYSCLENPVDRGAWCAAVHGVAQSQTWMKWVSMHACIGEGNSNPLQNSCLENPRDRGAWWAAICGVAQSRAWLKRLSSSSSMPQGSIFLYFLNKTEL